MNIQIPCDFIDFVYYLLLACKNQLKHKNPVFIQVKCTWATPGLANLYHSSKFWLFPEWYKYIFVISLNGTSKIFLGAGGILEGVYEIELDTNTEYEGF